MNELEKNCGRFSCVIAIVSSVIALGTNIVMLYFICMKNLGILDSLCLEGISEIKHNSELLMKAYSEKNLSDVRSEKLQYSQNFQELKHRLNEIDEQMKDVCFSMSGGFYFTKTRKCYIYCNTKMLSWHEARAECMKNKNGDLATIADQATQDFVKSSFIFSKWIWLGGIRTSGKWTWADGTIWTGFDLNTQNDDGHDYLFMETSYDWNDWTNSHKSHFLCQY